MKELTLAAIDERVDLLIGQPPHEIFILAQPFWRQELAEKSAGARVLGRVLGRDVFCHWQLVTVFLDQFADIITAGAKGQTGKRPRERDTRREGRVLIDLECLLVAGDS